MSLCRFLRRWLFPTLALLWAATLNAAEYPCYRLPSEPALDGKGDDEAWRAAPESSGFYVLGKDSLAGEKQTSFKAGWRPDGLFLLVRCEEPAMDRLIGGTKDGAGMWSEDSIEMFFIPPETNGLFNFVANCRGARWNGMGDGDAKPLWNWTAKAGADRCGWVLEVKIPFAIFSRTPAGGERWRVNIARNILTAGDRYTCWPPLKDGFRDLERYGAFVFQDTALSGEECARIENEMTAPTRKFLHNFRLARLKSDLLDPISRLREESRTALAADRHPAFAEMRQRLADLDERAHAVTRSLEQAKDLSPEDRQAVSAIGAELARLQSDLRLAPLYPGGAGKLEVPFAVGTIGDQAWMDETGLGRADLSGPIRLSLVGGESASFRVWVIPFWRDMKDTTASVSALQGPEGKTLPAQTVQLNLPAAPWAIASGRIGMIRPSVAVPPGTSEGTYAGTLTIAGDGHTVARAIEIAVRPGRTLSNFVIELADVTAFSGEAKQTFAFENPRDGWVHVSASAEMKDDEAVSLGLDAEEARAVLTLKPGAAVAETMRKLPAGMHTICLALQGKPSVTRLTVRAVPEIIYASYRYDPRIGKEFGVFDWEFLKRHVLPNINTINGPHGLPPQVVAEQAAEWHSRGGRCVQDTGLPGLGHGASEPTVDETCQALGKALSLPHVDAILADECIRPHLDKNLIYAEAFRRLAADPQLKGKTVYPYIAGDCPPSPKASDFLRRVAELRCPIALEYYCIEKKTEEEAVEHIAKHADSYLHALRDVMDEPQRRAIFALFYETLSPCSANVYPNADFKVFLDMQMHYLANAPGLSAIYGIESYTSGYTDEETLRWMSRLFRHYCIEGHKDRMTGDPYILPYIRNADFAASLQDWEVATAEPGSVKATRVAKLGKWMGFWPSTPPGGDDCLWMKRSAQGPNRVSQEIRDLKPGRLYSLKLFTHDLTRPHVRAKHAVSVRLEGVEVQEARSFQAVFPGELAYTHKKDEDYNWLNCHCRVFRATGERGRLTISDWANDKEAGGPVGGETIADFVEIQPFVPAE